MRAWFWDTSTEPGGVGLATDQGVVACRTLPTGRRHARDLLAMLGELLDDQGWPRRQADLLAVGVGPGSFTGNRVAVMAAKTLALVTNAPLVAVRSVDWWARLAPPTAVVHVVIDAQRDAVYSASFQAGEERLPLAIRPVAEWRTLVLPGEVVAGPAAAREQAFLAPSVTILGPPTDFPAAAFWSLAIAQAENPVPPETLAPLYLRLSSAEEKRLAQQTAG
jgi:tRNA threonylcarbamoyladenosine biosynthesis protein TsaB